MSVRSLLPALRTSAPGAVSGTGGAPSSREFGIEGMGVVSTRGERSPRQRQPRRPAHRLGQHRPCRRRRRLGPVAGHAEAGPLAGRATAGDQLQGQRFRSAVQRRRTLAVLLLQSRRRSRRRRPLSRRGAPTAASARPRTSVPASTARATNGRRRPSRDGTALLFASDGFGGAGRHDLFVARWEGSAFVDPQAGAGRQHRRPTNSTRRGWATARRSCSRVRKDVDDAADAVVRRAVRRQALRRRSRRWRCRSTPTRRFTLGPAIDWNKPGEMLVTGTAKAPRAGKLDIYRMKAPAASGKSGCI